MPIKTIALMLPVALLLAQVASSQTNLYAPLDAKIQQVRAGSSLSPADKEEVHRQRTALLESMIKRTGKQFAGQWSAEDQAMWYIYRVKLALIDPETYVLPAWVDDLPDGWVPEEPDICPAIRARCQQAPDDTHLMLAVLFPALQAGDFRYAADTFVRLEKADPLLADLFMDRIARQGAEQQAKYGGVYRDFLAVIAGYKNEQDRLASSGNTLEVLSTEPASPAILGIGDRVSVRIRYRATSIDKPKIWCKSRPLDEVNMDEVYEFAGSVTSSTGVVTRWFQFNAPAKVDQVYATMTGDIPGETLLRISNAVDFAWVDRHADIPANADFESVRSV
ncbi:MAG: hypothetical protein IT440_13125, partial [Phycisphaeraceae bacterium]|nr:hypothetical protein [Phycisphaeraceae bacterium]